MPSQPSNERTDLIVEVFREAFAPLMEADPHAFRSKYRKMARDPHAFYRGSACLYYADVTREDDPWVDERTRAIWIHGDLHVENFGTYLNADGRLADAVRAVAGNGGRIIEAVHQIGPHGYRAIVLDSEGNRVALHSPTD